MVTEWEKKTAKYCRGHFDSPHLSGLSSSATFVATRWCCPLSNRANGMASKLMPAAAALKTERFFYGIKVITISQNEPPFALFSQRGGHNSPADKSSLLRFSFFPFSSLSLLFVSVSPLYFLIVSKTKKKHFEKILSFLFIFLSHSLCPVAFINGYIVDCIASFTVPLCFYLVNRLSLWWQPLVWWPASLMQRPWRSRGVYKTRLIVY